MTEPVFHRLTQFVPIIGGVVVYGIYRMHYVFAHILDVDVGLTAKDLCSVTGYPLGHVSPGSTSANRSRGPLRIRSCPPEALGGFFKGLT